ncbi:MAG: holo-ACP synthase [Planctomycetota bacterium]
MIVGIGVDVVEVERIAAALEHHGDRFVQRIFTPEEADYCRRSARPPERFATRFAAKEAALKALGVGWRRGLRLLDVMVSTDELGAPNIEFAGKVLQRSRRLGVERVHVSLSHGRTGAVAQVVLEGRTSEPDHL